MARALAAPAEAEEKVYEYGGQVFVTISAVTMGYIQAALRKVGADNPRELLRVAADRAAGKDEVLIELYTYGRVELGYHPRDLGPFFRGRVSHPSVLTKASLVRASRYRSSMRLSDRSW